MTRTEERLADALAASARRVRDEQLGPLVSPRRSAASRVMWRSQAWRGWLVPAAAAVSVVLVIGLVAAVTSGLGHGRVSAPSRIAPVARPAYFASFSSSNNHAGASVYSTSTGKLIAQVPAPTMPAHGMLYDNVVAAAPGDRTFYLEYEVELPVAKKTVSQIWIYSFSLTSSGRATPLVQVKGGVLPREAAYGSPYTLAASPDGTELALTADSGITDAYHDEHPDKIIVIDMLTGTHRTWLGGLYRKGKVFSIQDLSWDAAGQSVVFLASWCDYATGSSCSGGPVAGGYRDTQVRSVGTATGGGTLDQGRLLLRQTAQYPYIVAAYAGPGGSDITALVQYGHFSEHGGWQNLAVVRFSAVGNTVLGVDYRHSSTPGMVGPLYSDWLSADPSGQHLLLSSSGSGGWFTGWIGQGALHLLPINQPYNGYPITAW